MIIINLKNKFFIDYFNNKRKSMYPYTKFITIDESMCIYKGEIFFKQYMKDKHKKFGIKLFGKANAYSWYIYYCLPYLGKAFCYDKNFRIGSTIIKEKPKGHENKNFHFTFDNYYSNLYTFLYLNKKNIEFHAIFTEKKIFSKQNKRIRI